MDTITYETFESVNFRSGTGGAVSACKEAGIQSMG